MSDWSAGDSPGLMVYVARVPCCGNLIACSVDDGATNRNDLARNIAKWVRDGLQVERWELSAVRGAKWGCHCKAVRI